MSGTKVMATEEKKMYSFRVLERDIIKGILVLEIEYPEPGDSCKVYRYLDEKVSLPKPDNLYYRMADQHRGPR